MTFEQQERQEGPFDEVRYAEIHESLDLETNKVELRRLKQITRPGSVKNKAGEFEKKIEILEAIVKEQEALEGAFA